MHSLSTRRCFLYRRQSLSTCHWVHRSRTGSERTQCDADRQRETVRTAKLRVTFATNPEIPEDTTVHTPTNSRDSVRYQYCCAKNTARRLWSTNCFQTLKIQKQQCDCLSISGCAYQWMTMCTRKNTMKLTVHLWLRRCYQWTMHSCFESMRLCAANTQYKCSCVNSGSSSSLRYNLRQLAMACLSWIPRPHRCKQMSDGLCQKGHSTMRNNTKNTLLNKAVVSNEFECVVAHCAISAHLLQHRTYTHAAPAI